MSEPPSRRRLPHIYPEGAWLFATWHLHGSLPQARFPPPGKPSAGKAFVWMGRYLDTTYRWSSAWKDGELKFAAAR